MKTAVQATLAAIAMFAAVVLAPIMLVVAGSYPRMGTWPHPSDPQLVVMALTAVGWLSWAAVVVVTVVEFVGQLTGRHRHVPGFGGLQRVVSVMVVMIVALIVSSEQAEPAATPPAAGHALDAATPTPAAHSTDAPTNTPPATDPSRNYTTAPGDDLWTLAERLLGDGRNWRQLTQLNPALNDPLAHLQPGTVLRLPATAHSFAAAPEQKAPRAADRTITVHKGDTLSALAKEHLGKASKWPKIVHANPVISDPDHIEIGWKLHIPGAKTPAATPAHQTPASPSTAPPTQLPAPPRGSSESAPVSPAPTPNPADSNPTTTASLDATARHPALPLTVGTLAASAVVGALELRRSLRQRTREIGTQEASASEHADRLRTLLRASAKPEVSVQFDAALRAIADHCRRNDLRLPVLKEARVSDDHVEFHWARPAYPPPPGFAGTVDRWVVDSPLPDNPAQPCPYPALVSLGTRAEGDTVLIDLERSGVLGISGSSDQAFGALAAMAVELSCAPWSSESQLVVVGNDTTLIERAGEDRVHVASLTEAENQMIREVARRRKQLEHVELATLRTDPDRADAVAPIVFCILSELPESRIAAFDQLLADSPTGIVLIVSTSSPLEAQWQISDDPERPAGSLSGRPGELAAHFINADTRSALNELFGEPPVVPAAWARVSNVRHFPTRVEDPLDIVRLHPTSRHPHLALIGPAELHDAAGPEPTRSRQQLIELAAWILEHPGSTATQMSAGLVLADSTRRSNLSRLRTWLGEDPEGQPYLPDGYSGRISLHSGITSDWQRLQDLLAEGIAQTTDSRLTSALELIRGAPLADATPSQWIWAEELRVNISEALRDVGLVLTDRALAAHNIDLARWAASRALVVAPEDEMLMCARLRTEYQAGNTMEAERLVTQLTRQARVLGVDLIPETIELCQQVIEGRVRARA